MILRPYQLQAIEQVRACMRQGHARVVLVVPTGGGKTVIAAEVVRSAVAKGKRVVWLAHRTELVDQACATLVKLGLDVGALSASSAFAVRLDAPVQVASIQTLVARETMRPPADLIVWDECHHAGEAAEEWVRLLDAYPMVHVLGLTATPERGDGMGLAPLFTGLVVGVTVRRLTQDGHLVPCEIDRPASCLRDDAGPNDPPNPLAQDPLKRYLETAKGRQGFLFARTVEEAEKYAADFTAAGVRSVCVHGKTHDDARTMALRYFRDGIVRMLMNVYVFTEGTDLPMAEVCILATCPGTAGGYLQRIGRILRPAPGKTSALLIDLPGASHRYGPPEDERIYKLTGRAIVRAGQVCRVCGQPVVEYPCEACGYAPSPDARESGDGTEVVDQPMAKYARKIAEGPEQRWETLVRWLRVARAKGHKSGSVRHKWKAVYGEAVDFGLFVKACAEVGYE